jgi:hypothetical protein
MQLLMPGPDKVLQPKKISKNWSSVWAVLGWRAFWRSFYCGRFCCAGGGRDFFWLTLLFAMIISTALLLVGSRAGLMESFTDAMLGTLRPHGVPIWVTSHWENDERIKSGFLEKLRNLDSEQAGKSTTGVIAHPYRRLERSRPRIRLPQDNIWQDRASWLGWAVYPDAPMWKLDLDAPPIGRDGSESWLGLPLRIVLSETQFAKHFDYSAYRAEIQPLLRSKKLQPLPAEILHGELKNVLHTLWLKIRVGDQEKLLPFKTRWIRHIPGLEKVAYLFPLSTYHALLAAHHLPELLFNPMNRGHSSPSSHQWLTGGDYPLESIAAYAGCLQKQVVYTGLNDTPRISEDICPKPDLAAIFSNVGKTLDSSTDDGENMRSWDTIDHDNLNRLWLPCAHLPRTNIMRVNLCPNGSPGTKERPLFVPWDVTNYGSAFKTVRVYKGC